MIRGNKESKGSTDSLTPPRGTISESGHAIHLQLECRMKGPAAPPPTASGQLEWRQFTSGC